MQPHLAVAGVVDRRPAVARVVDDRLRRAHVQQGDAIEVGGIVHVASCTRGRVGRQVILLPDVVHHRVRALSQVGLEEAALRIPHLVLLRPHAELQHVVVGVDARDEVVIVGDLAEGEANLDLTGTTVADAEGIRPQVAGVDGIAIVLAQHRVHLRGVGDLIDDADVVGSPPRRGRGCSDPQRRGNTRAGWSAAPMRWCSRRRAP